MRQRVSSCILRFIFVLGGFAVVNLEAQACPNLIYNAKKLILVTTTDISSKSGILRTFERAASDGGWKASRQKSEPVVLGRDGLGWSSGFRDKARLGDPIKIEGDKRTPAGIFGLGNSFGFEAMDNRPGYIQLKYGETFCVNDPKSPYYNTIVSRSLAGQQTTGEEMRAIDLYRRGFLIQYPTNASERAGSCIFLHLWRSPQTGTLGCVAMQEKTLSALAEWVSDNGTAIVILPERALSNFGACLPQELD